MVRLQITVTLTTPEAWLQPDISCQRRACERCLPPCLPGGEVPVHRQAQKRGEIMAGVHAEGNVPLSARTPGYSSAYHYPLKDGTNYTNMADHN